MSSKSSKFKGTKGTEDEKGKEEEGKEDSERMYNQPESGRKGLFSWILKGRK